MRKPIAVALFALAWLMTPGAVQADGMPSPILNVRQFGAKGDGRTDDYLALQAAAQAINKAHGGTLLFPPGTYLINRHITGAPNETTHDIAFLDCDGLVIRGTHTKLVIQGNFERHADFCDASRQHWYSRSRSIQPFLFGRCKHFRLEGFELDGGIRQGWRDPHLTETPGSGVVTVACSDYELRDLYIHHFQTDGLCLGVDSKTADRRAKLVNVVSNHNARQGLSVIQLRGGSFLDCRCEHTGETDGAYGGHWPKAGVDIEPDYDMPTMDVRTGDLRFEHCVFRDNQGDQVLSLTGSRVENVRFDQCLIARGTSHYPYDVRLLVNNGQITDSHLAIADLELAWQGIVSRTLIRGCVITTRASGLHADQAAEAVVEDNWLYGQQDSLSMVAMPDLRDRQAIFRRNQVYLPAASYTALGLGAYSRLSGLARSEHNVFTHDRNAPPFRVRYDDTPHLADREAPR